MTNAAPPAEPVSSQERPSFRAWYALGILIVVVIFAYMTRQILSLSAQSIKEDLSLSDLQLGETTGVTPAIFALLAMYPVAWLADRFERRIVLALCVFFWSIATAASGFAVDFVTLLACTIAIVIGEAGLSPIGYSLLPDLFPKKHVPLANTIAYGATAFGAGLGMALGGLLIGAMPDIRPLLPPAIQSFETWRLTFFLIALPGPLIALAVILIGRTRRKQPAETAKAPAPMAPILPYLKKYGLVALGVFGTMGLFNFSLQAVGDWLPTALIRNFNAEPASVGPSFGMAFMGGVATGLLAANFITPYWRKVAGTAFVLRAISVAAAGTAAPVFLLAFATELWHVFALVFCWCAIFVTGVSLMPGMMQDVAPPVLRTRVIALGTVVFMMVGSTAAPLVGFISDLSEGSPRGLMWAIIGVAVTGFLSCSLLARAMEPAYRRTVAAVAEA